MKTSEDQFDAFRSLALESDTVRMSAMILAGFDVNTPNRNHETVFLHCCANNRLASARFLAERGANVNVMDHGGTTALDLARRHTSRDFQDWLTRIGGQPSGATHYAMPAPAS